jgi:hypothetical protein
MLGIFYSGLGSSTFRSRPDVDAEKCTGLSGPQCLEKLSLERRRREFIESPEGQEFLRAADDPPLRGWLCSQLHSHPLA